MIETRFQSELHGRSGRHREVPKGERETRNSSG